ncbi:MAG: 2-oxoglutarate/2-oxoacid ferredoxin oxidoreductase subunit alpha [Candidatus Atribacteria bacterium]|nr:2-oxoglutarate/2-oxoacid ferredoxin oxidoreductase subunit alpha [Candidatus Atribacteria bacterium]
MVDFTLKIGGAAGQGVQTVAEMLSRVILRAGWYVFSIEDYQSRVRGGHTFTQIRFSDVPIFAAHKKIDLLVALNPETYELHRGEVVPEGIIIGMIPSGGDSASQEVAIDFEGIAEEIGNRVFANVVAVGSILAVLGFDFQLAEKYLETVFGRKGPEIVAKNQQALKRGKEEITGRLQPPFSFENLSSQFSSRYLMSGNEGLGLGALLAGCRFYSAYPMTPSTGIMNFLSSRAERYGIVVEQAEDEVAAINMAVGASFAGARAMTGTSGGGFCLMTEGLGLAAMTETPIVIVDAQRPGPSTGLPTRTSQGDLEFVLHASHEEFPRVVFAPSDAQDAVNKVIKAFNLSEKYQVPVIILSDQYLADSRFSYPDFKIREAPLAPQYLTTEKDYQRYLITENGISPRGIPGEGEGLVIADSDEHDEAGHLTEDLTIRVKMHQKRMNKLAAIRQEVGLPLQLSGKDLTLIGWGSTLGVLLEVREVLHQEGVEAGVLHFTELYPLPPRVGEILDRSPQPVVVEANFSGQFARFLEGEYRIPLKRRINKYDGRPFLVENLLEQIKGVI